MANENRGGKVFQSSRCWASTGTDRKSVEKYRDRNRRDGAGTSASTYNLVGTIVAVQNNLPCNSFCFFFEFSFSSLVTTVPSYSCIIEHARHIRTRMDTRMRTRTHTRTETHTRTRTTRRVICWFNLGANCGVDCW